MFNMCGSDGKTNLPAQSPDLNPIENDMVRTQFAIFYILTILKANQKLCCGPTLFDVA